VAECPAENGYFADALQCDRYYECKQGEVQLFKPLLVNCNLK
jgi:Chitin binding Peritrophin-A domain